VSGTYRTRPFLGGREVLMFGNESLLMSRIFLNGDKALACAEEEREADSTGHDRLPSTSGT
jgi:hypothetical protein